MDSCDSTIFSAHEYDGTAVIGILDCEVQKLSCYRILGDQRTEHMWTKPALSAVAIEATRKQQRDILILSEKGVLELWTGHALEVINCHVDLPGNRDLGHLEPSKLKTAVHDTLNIVDMRDAVENRVSLVLNNATILRVQLDFTVRSSLVQECLDALSYALPIDILWDFKHRFLQLNYEEESKYEEVSTKDEWGNFTTTLLSYCDPSSTPPLLSPRIQARPLPGLPKKPAAPEVSDADWNFFLDSDMHQLLGNHPSFRGEPLLLPVSSSDPYTDMISQAKRLATHYYRGPATRGAMRLDYYYKFILVALHLVYEDRSISQATFKEGDMSTFLTLMAHLVRWNTWVDIYSRRDFTNGSATQLPGMFILDVHS